MKLAKRLVVRIIVRIIIGLAAFFAVGPALADDNPQPGEEVLQEVYGRNIARLETSPFGIPLYLDSFEQGDRVHVDVYGIFAYPFTSVSSVLKEPASWCDIVALHPNVKACTYQNLEDAWLLTFYLGRKTFQPPQDARQVIYHFRDLERGRGYLDIALTAAVGPLGTKDHQLKFEALPLDGAKTFVHVTYAYKNSAFLSLAEKVYFSTRGRDKVGFTVAGTDQRGKPVYITGPRGAIERNAVRYYFAIQAVMDSLPYPEKSRFNIRTSNWFDLTNRYPRQLFELEKSDYLSFKKKEYEHQLALQRSASTVHP
jgi:hypothetical protein